MRLICSRAPYTWSTRIVRWVKHGLKSLVEDSALTTTILPNSRYKTWVVKKIGWDNAEADEFEFWQQLMPEERIKATWNITESLRKMKGKDVPRLRRVCRVITKK